MSIEIEILPDNPAARLQSILTRMIGAQYSVDAYISSAFAKMFDAQDIPSKILHHYSQMFVLIDDAYNKVIQYYPKQINIHASWRAHFIETFKNHSPYHHQWGNLINSLRHGTHLDMLQIANDNLQHYVRPTTIHGLSLAELEEQVSTIIVEIENSDELSEYLKVFLKEELTKILNYIKHFDLYGSDPIRKSIYNVIGNIEVSKKYSSKAITKVSALLIAVASSIGLVNDVASFPESIEKLQKSFYLTDVKAHANSSDESNPEPDILLKAETEK